MRHNFGFTLIEFMVTIGMAAIQVAVAPPSMTDAVTVAFEPYRTLPDSNAASTIAPSKTLTDLQAAADVLGRVQVCSPGASFGG